MQEYRCIICGKKFEVEELVDQACLSKYMSEIIDEFKPRVLEVRYYAFHRCEKKPRSSAGMQYEFEFVGPIRNTVKKALESIPERFLKDRL